LSWHVQDDVADKITIPNFDLFYWDAEKEKMILAVILLSP